MSACDGDVETANDSLVQQLTVIATLAPGDRVRTQSGVFVVDKPTPMQGIKRLWYGESRTINITAIENLFGRCWIAIDTAIARERYSGASDLGARVSTDRLRNIQMISRLIRAHEAATSALTNVAVTYETDVSVRVRVTSLRARCLDYTVRTTQSMDEAGVTMSPSRTAIAQPGSPTGDDDCIGGSPTND